MSSANALRGPLPKKAHRPVKQSRDTREATTKKRREDRAELEKEISSFHDDAKRLAVRLSTTHSLSVPRVLQKMYMSGSMKTGQRTKANAWSAYLHMRSSEKNKGAHTTCFACCTNTHLRAGRAIGDKTNLLEVSADIREEYNALTDEQKSSIAEEHSKRKAAQVNGFRVTPQSKVRDMSQTMSNVKELVRCLKSSLWNS